MSEIFGVIGAGTMGNGIAQVAARSGFLVRLQDISEQFIERGLKAIDKSLQRDIDKQRLTDDEKRSIQSRIQPTTDLSLLNDASFVVEAVSENLDIKIDVF